MAVHAHPAAAVTVTSKVEPAAVTFAKLLGATLNVQADAAPPWLTVKTTPAIDTVPVRANPVLAATLNEMVLLPDPVGLRIVIHGALLVASELQPGAVVTVAVSGPPDAATLPALLDKVALQG
jgi:hypothetical protein